MLSTHHDLLGRGHISVDPFDVPLQDDDLMDEVELTASLIVAANQTTDHLSVGEIDQILGLGPQRQAS